MRLLQALRRSIKGEKEKPQISITPKSAIAIVPPKKVGSSPHPCLHGMHLMHEHLSFTYSPSSIFRLLCSSLHCPDLHLQRAW